MQGNLFTPPVIISSIKPEQHKHYKAKVSYRTAESQNEGILTNGSLIHVRAMWRSREGNYEGQMIFKPAEHKTWINEQDLELIGEITAEKYHHFIV